MIKFELIKKRLICLKQEIKEHMNNVSIHQLQNVFVKIFGCRFDEEDITTEKIYYAKLRCIFHKH